MLGAGIHHDDILVVDRSLTPDAGKIVVCALNGELTVKRLAREDQQWRRWLILIILILRFMKAWKPLSGAWLPFRFTLFKAAK